MRAQKKKERIKTMAIGMGPLDLKKAPPKLNSELASPAAKKSIATSAGNARSSAAHIITISSAAHTSGNIFFTPASSWGHRPRPVTGRNMSLAANYRRAAGQRFNSYANRFWQSPSLSLANQANIAYKQSTASSIGEALGALAGLVTTGANAYKTLNEAGVFNKKSTNTGGAAPTAKGGGNQVTEATDKLFGKTARTLPSASTEVKGYIDSMSSCTDAKSLGNAITIAKGELSSLNSASSIYESAASEAQSQLSELSTKISQEFKPAVEGAESRVSRAEGKVNEAETARNGAIKDLKNVDAEYGTAVENYTQAHDSYVNAQNVTKRAESTEQQTKTEYDTAKTNKAAAQSECSAAEKAYEACPDTITNNQGIKIPNPQKAQLKAKLEIAKEKLKQADEAETKAKNAHEKAQEELKVAQQNEKKEKAAESDALKKKEDAYKNVGTKKTEVDNAERQVKIQQQGVDQCKTNLLDAQKNSDTATRNLEQAEAQVKGDGSIVALKQQHEASIQSLQKAIGEQQTRLDGMKSGKTTEEPAQKDDKTYSQGNITQGTHEALGGKDANVTGINLSNMDSWRDADFSEKYRIAKENNNTNAMNKIMAKAEERGISPKQVAN